MKNILVMIAVMVVMAFAAENSKHVTACRVSVKGVVMCEIYRQDGRRNVVTYHFKKDGSVVEKFYQGDPSEYGINSDRRVFASMVKKMERWPCLEKRSSGDYKVVGGDCSGRSGIFLKKIADGEDLKIVDLDGNVHPLTVGFPEIALTMTCDSTTKVTTFGIHNVTNFITSMKVFDNLPPGTYCEDFLATDALYWKP
jgi:hypothetical protein